MKRGLRFSHVPLPSQTPMPIMARRSAEVKQRVRERGILQEIVVLGLAAKGHLLAPLSEAGHATSFVLIQSCRPRRCQRWGRPRTSAGPATLTASRNQTWHSLNQQDAPSTHSVPSRTPSNGGYRTLSDLLLRRGVIACSIGRSSPHSPKMVVGHSRCAPSLPGGRTAARLAPSRAQGSDRPLPRVLRRRPWLHRRSP